MTKITRHKKSDTSEQNARKFLGAQYQVSLKLIPKTFAKSEIPVYLHGFQSLILN